jgi:hypothetical protein
VKRLKHHWVPQKFVNYLCELRDCQLLKSYVDEIIMIPVFVTQAA